MKRYDAPQNALSVRSRATERRDTPSRFADGGHHAQSRLLGLTIRAAYGDTARGTFRAGKVIRREVFQTPAEAREAAGVR
jgi:hypothetical protein